MHDYFYVQLCSGRKVSLETFMCFDGHLNIIDFFLFVCSMMMMLIKGEGFLFSIRQLKGSRNTYNRDKLVGQVVGDETNDRQNCHHHHGQSSSHQAPDAREVAFGRRVDVFVAEDGESHAQPYGHRVRGGREVDVEDHKLHPALAVDTRETSHVSIQLVYVKCSQRV